MNVAINWYINQTRHIEIDSTLSGKEALSHRHLKDDADQPAFTNSSQELFHTKGIVNDAKFPTENDHGENRCGH